MTPSASRRPRRRPARVALAAGGAVALAAVLAGCGQNVAQPQEVESCLRQEGLGVARQPGVSPPVETKINFDITSGMPDPENAGSVIYYASEDDAARNLRSSGGSGPKGPIEQRGRVLYTPFGAQSSTGRTAQQSREVVESCVSRGQPAAAEDDDADGKRKKRRSGRRR